VRTNAPLGLIGDVETHHRRNETCRKEQPKALAILSSCNQASAIMTKAIEASQIMIIGDVQPSNGMSVIFEETGWRA
jgi:hypothetical protein